MTNFISEHEHWMELALLQARKAASEDEIPVGAVLVKDRQVILQITIAPASYPIHWPTRRN